jgi:hypoxanthine-DNA glycosylase
VIETHPFGTFEPKSGPRYLILGSFSAKEAAAGTEATYDWFYAVKRNQFWPILEEVYGRELKSRRSKEQLFEELRIAIADIIYQCERKSRSSLDSMLTNIVYATKEITTIVDNNQINSIFFTSRFTETHFRREFRDAIHRHPSIELVTLPSPSPRYARISKNHKVEKYKELLPLLSK